MNFYIDFEATQFTEEIISIGCVAENGNTFNCLVCPSDPKKVTKFITELTGITREMVEKDGLSPEMAFCRLYEFVKANNGDEMPVYYCYGGSDKNFIKNTVKNMKNLNMIIFASSIQALMVDYSATVKNYLSVNGLSLKKLVALIRHVEAVDQNHDALEDALMLKECFEGLPTLEKPEPIIKPIANKPSNNKFQEAYTQLVNEQGLLQPVKLIGREYNLEEVRYLRKLRLEDWGQVNASAITGDANENTWKVKLTHIKTGAVKYFTEPWVAAMFFNGYVLTGRSPKAPKSLNATMKEMAGCPNNFGGYRCELRYEIPNVKGE